MHDDALRRLAAELIGTALLILFGAGSFVAALTVEHGKLTYAGIGFIAISFALIIAVIIYAFGNLSGGHFNPAVTIALAITKRFSWIEVGPYILAQMAGAVLGGALIIGTFGTGAADIHATGGTTLGEGVNYAQGVLAEGVATYFVMLAVMALAVDKRAPLGWAGLMIGLAVAGEILVVGPLTSGSVNPARTTGPYLMSEIFGSHAPPWGQHFIYWVGPCAGALAATLTEAIHLRNQVLARLEAAESASDAGARRRALTFVFVGSGYAGVEALAGLEDLAREASRSYRSVRRAEMRWILLEATDRILGTMQSSRRPSRGEDAAATRDRDPSRNGARIGRAREAASL